MLVTKVMKQVTTEVQDGVTVTFNKDQAEQLMAIVGGINHPARCIAQELYDELYRAGVNPDVYYLKRQGLQVTVEKKNG